MASRNPVRDANPPPAGRGERLFEILGSVRFLMRASGVAFIVVVNAMIGYGVWQRHSEAVQGAERSTRNLARILEEQAVRTVFSVDLLLSDLVTVLDTHPQARTVAAPSVNALLRNRRDAIGPISGLIVVDETGRPLHHSADTSPPRFDLTDRPYFAAHRDGRGDGSDDGSGAGGGLHVGAPIASIAFPGTYVIPMSRRWSHPDGSFAGVVVAMINPLRLGAGFEGLRLGLEGTVTLALADGTVLIHRPWDEGRKRLAKLADWPEVDAVLRTQDAATLDSVLPTDGRPSIASVRRVADYPFIVAATLPKAEALGEWKRDSAVWIAMGLAMSVVIALLTWYVERQQARREQDQSRLERASRRIRGILDSMVDAVVTIDSHGTIETFNPAAERMFGYAEAEVVGQSVNILLPEAFRAGHDRSMAEYRPNAGSRIIGNDREVLALRRDGGTFPMNLAVSELRLGGQGGAARRVFVGVIRDITKRKQQEAELLASKSQAEMANRAKSEFLANMSHELRTPLNAIIGFSEILDSEFFGKLNDRQKACAKDIHDSGKHLLDIVNAVLDMSKIEAGRYELSEEVIDPCEAVAQCLTMVRDRAADSGVDLRNNVSGGLPAIWVDRRAFKQVLLNLLSNAVKFTPEGGSVTLAARVEEDGALALSVTDTGIGIPKEFMEHMFKPFRQADNSSSRQFEGTGLGLSISKNFMELHGGSLTCASTPGAGTTMTLRLPAERVVKPEDTATKIAAALV
ncbi:ATP-binding protein [Azospirillum isscasi]|uniref:histidine kinase n=1 Tax=Azospirillum isscasi TaxID=3053926 RepID=A0ABU0WJQ1_9PROT|nr:ATP-binding protein [Azospirillum isscasi]MDQ2104461.1 ATP-binding protein [Azospirillum isscasi]